MACIYLLKKVWEEVFLTLLKDIAKQIISTFNHMIIKKPGVYNTYLDANNL